MAVGDMVSGIGADNAIFAFIPAAGVVIIITSVNSVASKAPRIWNGTDKTEHGISDNQYSLKFFINTTNYLRIDPLGAGKRSGYTGMQIA